MAANSNETLKIPPEGPWLELWISSARFTPFVRYAKGDRLIAYKLYRWNAEASAAVLRDVGYFEVALRNAYHRELSVLYERPSWVHQAAQLFPSNSRHSAGAAFFNDMMHRSLTKAVFKYRYSDSRILPGKVVAELSFTFWAGLSDAIYNQTLWRPALHTVWPKGVSPRWLHGHLQRLRDLRNRVAHHEQILTVNLAKAAQDIQCLSEMLLPELGQLLAATSRLPRLEKAKPERD
jgi:hypothetical protein